MKSAKIDTVTRSAAPIRNPGPKTSTGAHTGTHDGAERRRAARILRDERGNPYVEWVPAPAGTPRVTLEVLEPGQTAPQHGFDPYASGAGTRPLPAPAPTSTPTGTTRTDLRKLSEHIKLMRTLEQRRRKDGRK